VSAARLETLRRLPGSLGVAVLAVVPYLGVLDSPFVFDDLKLVAQNEHLRSGLRDPRSILATFNVLDRQWDGEDVRPNYRPFRFLSYHLDYEVTRRLYGEPPAAGPPVLVFHLTNILLHALNAVLVVAIVRRLARDLLPPPAPGAGGGAETFALVAGLLFALHPLATEAVTYVSGRRDVLSTCLYLGALAVALRAGRDAAPGTGAMTAMSLLLICGIWTKETVTTFPAALLLVDWARRARFCARRLVLHALAWAVAALGIAAALGTPGLIAAPAAAGPLELVLTVPRYVARYLGLSLLPLSQSIDYSFAAIPPSTGPLSPWTTLPALALVLGLAAAGLWGLARARQGGEPRPAPALLAIGLLWFLGTLAPVLQIVPIPERFAERFAYLPLVGIVLCLAAGLAALCRWERVLGLGAAGILCLAALGGTVARNRDWGSPLALWTAAVRAQPRAARAHLARANALKDLGVATKSQSVLREALEEYTQAVSIFEEEPDVPLHHGSILQALTLRGGVNALLGAAEPEAQQRAIADLRRVLAMKDVDGVAIESSPKHTLIHLDLGGVLLQRDQRAAAAAEYRRVLEIDAPPAHRAAAEYYLGKIAGLDGKLGEAGEHLSRAYGLIPLDDPSKFRVAVELADALIDQKSFAQAATAVERALADGATGALRHHLLTRLAKAQDRQGEIEACIATLERILREDPQYAPALITLAGIEASQGRHEKAEERYRAVLARDAGNAGALQGLQQVQVLRRIAAQEGPDALPQVGEKQVLETLAVRAVQTFERGELLAARELYKSLVEQATAARDVKSQALGLRGLAEIEGKLGRAATAEGHLKAALELAPGEAQTLRALGDHHWLRRRDAVQARRSYELAIEALPRGQEADGLLRFHLAEAIGKSDPGLALEHLRLARAAGYDEPALDRSTGYLAAAAGRWRDALDAFNRYLERTPSLDRNGREDPEREAVKVFVKEEVIQHVVE
jgi:tetratricopeptide (TPR) repeat protein